MANDNEANDHKSNDIIYLMKNENFFVVILSLSIQSKETLSVTKNLSWILTSASTATITSSASSTVAWKWTTTEPLVNPVTEQSERKQYLTIQNSRTDRVKKSVYK